ncbi:MAG TPA: winged helix-turn-helix domain-containing protein [Nitrososphaeraceae archaeon]
MPLKNNSIKYRRRDEIIRSILDSTTGDGCTKTRIMYSSFLSYPQLIEYLEYLTGHSLIEHDISTKTYKITEKGLKLLNICNEIEEMVK